MNKEEKLKPLGNAELFSNSKGFQDGGGEGNRTFLKRCGAKDLRFYTTLILHTTHCIKMSGFVWRKNQA